MEVKIRALETRTQGLAGWSRLGVGTDGDSHRLPQQEREAGTSELCPLLPERAGGCGDHGEGKNEAHHRLWVSKQEPGREDSAGYAPGEGSVELGVSGSGSRLGLLLAQLLMWAFRIFRI